MVETSGLMFGPLSPATVHLCVDMQRLFAGDGPWPVPWIHNVEPHVEEIVRHHAEQTVFTRFLPPRDAASLPGAWKRFYDKWRDVTLERLDPEVLELLPPLKRFVPPAVVVDRYVYSAFAGSDLARVLGLRHIDTLVISGGETDMCVLATALAAVDRGYRVIMIADALCSSSDAGHDALVDHFNRRFSQQIETVNTETLLSAWSRG